MSTVTVLLDDTVTILDQEEVTVLVSVDSDIFSLKEVLYQGTSIGHIQGIKDANMNRHSLDIDKNAKR